MNPLLRSFFLLGLTSLPLRAEHQPTTVKAEATTATAQQASQPGPRLMQQDDFTGDWGGLRTKLADRGIVFGLNVIQELLGNPTGGVSRGLTNEGRVELSLDLDGQALLHLPGSSFHANAYYIYGSDLSAGHLGNLLTVSNIEAYDTLRLFDLWYQQEFLEGKVSLRFGQLAADDEFLVSDYGATFINGTFGWPALTAVNLPSGGPGYPLATPAVRLRIDPGEAVSLLAAVFDGDPGDSPGSDNPQKRNSTGTRIDFNQGALGIFEAQFRLNQGKDARGLPGTYKLGGFYATQNFGDLAQDGDGLSLADPAGSGSPRAHASDWGVYAIADQMVYRPEALPPPAPTGGADPKSLKKLADAGEPNDVGLALFCRIGGAPTNRNTVDLYVDGGLNYKGLFPGRRADVLGVAVGYAHLSDDLADLDRATNAFSSTDLPVHDEELALELTYQAKLAPWWTVQPDLQYIVHPGGNVADPNEASGGSTIPDAFVIGIRTSLSF